MAIATRLTSLFGCSGELVVGLCGATRANANKRADLIYRYEAVIFIHNRVKLNANDRRRAAMDIFRVKNGKTL